MWKEIPFYPKPPKIFQKFTICGFNINTILTSKILSLSLACVEILALLQTGKVDNQLSSLSVSRPAHHGNLRPDLFTKFTDNITSKIKTSVPEKSQSAKVISHKKIKIDWWKQTVLQGIRWSFMEWREQGVGWKPQVSSAEGTTASSQVGWRIGGCCWSDLHISKDSLASNTVFMFLFIHREILLCMNFPL